jgi:hypothetical protein
LDLSAVGYGLIGCIANPTPISKFLFIFKPSVAVKGLKAFWGKEVELHEEREIVVVISFVLEDQ